MYPVLLVGERLPACQLSWLLVHWSDGSFLPRTCALGLVTCDSCVGVDLADTQKIATSCGTGVTATVLALVHPLTYALLPCADALQSASQRHDSAQTMGILHVSR